MGLEFLKERWFYEGTDYLTKQGLIECMFVGAWIGIMSGVVVSVYFFGLHYTWIIISTLIMGNIKDHFMEDPPEYIFMMGKMFNMYIDEETYKEKFGDESCSE